MTHLPSVNAPHALVAGADYTVWLCTYAPGYTMPRHAHDTTALSLVLAGELEERSNRTEVTGSSLSVVVKPAGVPHANRFGPRGARMLAVVFAPSFLEDLDVQAEGFGRWQWGHGGPLAAPALRLWQAASHPDSVADALDDALVDLVDTLHEGSAPSGTAPDWLGEVRDRLHDEFEAPPSAQALAAMAGVHRVHLARRFRQHFGCSTTAYLRRLRVQAAAHALASTRRPLAEVALDAGFADQPHLSRTFKAVTGVTPGAFRVLMQG